MRGIKDINNLKDNKVLLRVDFNVPSKDRKITEDYRIKAHKKTIDFLLSGGATVALASHAEGSFRDLASQISEILGHDVSFESDILGPKLNSSLTLFENIRNYSGEEGNDNEFAKELARNFDIYVNDAFSVSHRNHASISAIKKFLPSYRGFLIDDEISHLSKVLSAPIKGKIIIMGGAKASTKIPVVKNFINKAEKIILGGVIANDILKEKGYDIGVSESDEDTHNLLKGLDLDNPKLILPTDFNIVNNKFLDVGPNSIKKFTSVISDSEMVVWNGPLGYYENNDYAVGTNELAKAITNSVKFKVIGGGDTITAVDKIGLIDKFDFISTGGGAMLAYLAGQDMPGLE